MSIEIKRVGTKVQVDVTISVPFANSWIWHLQVEASSEWGAGFLAKALRDYLWERVKLIRETAYNRGWDDHKKRLPRKDWFDGCINRD